MFLLHYILPFIIFYIVSYKKRKNSKEGKKFLKNFFIEPIYPLKNEKGIIKNNKIIFWGLIFGNLIDLDHIYFRIIGKAPWFHSACRHLFAECSLGFYPLHQWWFLIVLVILFPFVFAKNKWMKFIGWLAIGAMLNLFLDFISLKTGIFI